MPAARANARIFFQVFIFILSLNPQGFLIEWIIHPMQE
ncbi:hypothetical protein BACCAP_01383 [Pseudoflavonifractor capillosus ATCC 29799]|uniref:Uncharacterized protein n=1 Tax=Pseudoflavonifractor capillosus ATCC 29799 TaxID=411467 RepID=A6NT55_9FIRM|nr:hypothetical protein BACCAP_01383 [Pseudoflavonifractor capillosus ATCC 29799]